MNDVRKRLAAVGRVIDGHVAVEAGRVGPTNGPGRPRHKNVVACGDVGDLPEDGDRTGGKAGHVSPAGALEPEHPLGREVVGHDPKLEVRDTEDGEPVNGSKGFAAVPGKVDFHGAVETSRVRPAHGDHLPRAEPAATGRDVGEGPELKGADVDGAVADPWKAALVCGRCVGVVARVDGRAAGEEGQGLGGAAVIGQGRIEHGVDVPHADAVDADDIAVDAVLEAAAAAGVANQVVGARRVGRKGAFYV